MDVIKKIGIRAKGSFHPISMAEGIKTRNEINTPFNELFNLIFMFAIKYPDITQRENADKFASHVSFWRIIGITSTIPAIIPNSIPIFIFFICLLYQTE